MVFSLKKKTPPRDDASSISAGKAEAHHLGKHTIGTMTQEVFSLKNTKPMFRGSKWKKRRDELRNTCLELAQKNRNFSGLANELHGALAPLEI